MNNSQLLVLGAWLGALLFVPNAAQADSPPAHARPADVTPGKSGDKPGDVKPHGPPGVPGIPGAHGDGPGKPEGKMPDTHDGMPGRHGTADGGALEMHAGMHGMHRFSAMRQLREEIKDGKLKKEDLKAQLDKLHQTAAERGKAHREDLLKRWGSALSVPSARNELKLHARRMAFLDRALLVAQTDNKPNKDKMLERISKLIDKENQRHESAMARFAAEPSAAAGTPAVAAPAASAASGGAQ
jgi:hypothetical protein